MTVSEKLSQPELEKAAWEIADGRYRIAALNRILGYVQYLQERVDQIEIISGEARSLSMSSRVMR